MNYLYFLIPVVWLLVSIILFVGTFVCYAAVIKMRDRKDELLNQHWTVRWTCFAVLAVGLLLDTALNWFTLTIVYLEPPFEFLSTSRVVRHKFKSTGYRQKLSLWFCKNWLTPIDPNHCEE